MIRDFSARAGRSLVGTFALAAVLMLPAASASARDITEFSAQDRVGGPPRVRGGGAPHMKGPLPARTRAVRSARRA